MARDSEARVIRQHTIEPARPVVCPVGNRDLAGVQRVANADAAAVMKRDPACAARGVEKRVQDGPVGNRVRAILHCFGLAEG
jgi:hypothetical protein